MTPWVLRLIIANIVVYFLERTGTGIANAARVRAERCAAVSRGRS